MKTFTTYAEKKAKQFLNLLQGYTKGIRMTAILILLLMGVNNAWGAGQHNMNWNGKVYFLVPEKWDISTYKNVQVDITRTQANDESKHQEYVGNMTRVGESRLYYLKLSANHSNWNQYEYLAFTANKSIYGSGQFNLNVNALRTKPIDYGCNNSSNFYLFKPDSESNFNTTTNDNTMSGDWNSKRDDLLLKKQTVDLYLDNTKSNAGGTVKMTGYEFSSTTATTTLTSKDVTSSSSSVSYSGVVGSTMTLVATVNSGYSFLGWYSGDTQLSTNATYSYCIYDTKTIKAKFKENTYSYTVTAGEGGTVSPASGTVAQGSGVTIEATPNDGYEFDKWTATNGTLANANSASTTFTPSANNANATASFKVADCTQTPTTPTSLTAKVGGNTLAGAVCSGTNVTLTAEGSISVGSLQWGTGTVGENIIAEGNGRSSITVSPAATTTYWVRSIITEAGVCEGVTSDAKTLQVSITPALVQPVLSKSALTLEEGGSTGSISVTSGTTGGTWTSSDPNVATVNNGTVTPKGPGTATITYTVSNGCEADKTATCTVTVNAKPYYIAGRLQQKWDPNSKAQQFTYVSNGQYKYETGKTVAELSVGWSADNNYLQYFFIHTGTGLSSSFTSSNNNGHNFHQKLGYANALTLSSNSENKEAKYIKFADVTDNSSDVVIWWEPSTNKLWYTATANLNTNYYLLGFGNSNWTVNDSRRFVKDENDPTKAKVTITLAKGEYKYNTNDGFKINDNFTGKWYGNNYTMTRSNCTGWSFEEGKNNAGLTADVAGDYVFTLDLTTMKLSVTYPEAYAVTYGVGNNKGTDAVTTDPTITSGDLVLASTSIEFRKGDTKAGYTWKNWNSKADGTGTKLGTGDTYTSTNRTSNITVYACYDLITYNITYNLNGGTGATNTTYNVTTATFNLPTPTKTGYDFAGWYDNAGLTGNEVTQVAKGSTGDKAFWAKWTPKIYNITYKDQGGSNFSGTHADGHPTTHTYGTETTLKTASKTGYSFDGWHTDAACTQKVTSLNATAYTDNINLYAQWTEILSTITITTNPEEGGSIEVDGQPFTPGNTVQVGVATFKLVTAVPNEGYGVAQWGIKGSATFGGGSTTFKLYGDGTNAAGELIANFIGKEYTITFDRQDGTGGTEKATVNYKNNNYSVTPVIAPTRAGYTFGGYYTQAAGASVQVVSAEGQWLANATGYTDAQGKWVKADNVTLYAKWTESQVKHEVRVLYMCGDVVVKAEETIEVGEILPTSITAPTVTGYTFSEWKLGDGLVTTNNLTAQKINLTTKPSGDYTLTANYIKYQYTLTFGVLGYGGSVSAIADGNEIASPAPLGQDTEVTLTATAKDGYEFYNWIDANGNEVSKVNPYVHTMTASTTINAVFKNTRMLYLKPNDGWKGSSARFAAYFYRDGSGDNYWADMTSEFACDNPNGIYKVPIPDGTWTHVIFVRMNPSFNENRWNRNDDGDNKPVWNQTGNLEIPDDEKNLFTIPEGNWDGATTTWTKHISTYDPVYLTYNVEVPEGTPNCYISGEINGWSFTEMEKVDDTHYTITIQDACPDDEYKYCYGPSWGCQEVKKSDFTAIDNRKHSADDKVEAWIKYCIV